MMRRLVGRKHLDCYMRYMYAKYEDIEATFRPFVVVDHARGERASKNDVLVRWRGGWRARTTLHIAQTGDDSKATDGTRVK